MISQACSAVAAGAAVLTFAVVSAPATATVAQQTPASRVADSAPATTARPDATGGRVLPYSGHYMGVDTHHRLVRFTMHNNQITHFTVNHTSFPNAHVQGHQWHHTCGNGLCTRGWWTTDTTVEGKWNDSRQGGEVHFTANLYSH